MKKNLKMSGLLGLIILVIISILAFGYHYYINIFDEHTIRSIDVTYQGHSPFPSSQLYTLDEGETEKLWTAIDTAIRVDHHDPSVKGFSVTLVNRYNISKTLEVYIYDQNAVYIKDKHWYAVQTPYFFLNHHAFDDVYSAISEPSILLKLGSVQHDLQSVHTKWSFKRYGGTWKSTEYKSASEADTLVISDKLTPLTLASDKVISQMTLKVFDTQKNTLVFEYQKSNLHMDGYSSPEPLPLPEYDGEFLYHVSLDWQDPNDAYKGNAQLSFKLTLDLPITFAISKLLVEQDDLIEVRAYHAQAPEAIEVIQDIYPSFKWYDAGTYLRGYLPTNYHTTPGSYDLILTDLEHQSQTTYTITVSPRNYLVQHLTIDPNIEAETVNDATVAEYNKYFTPVRNTSNPTRYYTEPFIIPAYGRLTTEFGETRFVNNRPTSYRHSGLDIAAPIGSDIFATNTGKVVLAMYLGWTGNTIVIDHGEGIFSVYFHLDALDVAEGDMVERGQRIGDMGTTGFSTGSHLHFSISYYHVNLEPGYFIGGEPILESNAANYLSKP